MFANRPKATTSTSESYQPHLQDLAALFVEQKLSETMLRPWVPRSSVDATSQPLALELSRMILHIAMHCIHILEMFSN